MNLKNTDVLLVDVTIIVGLLFFISLQSFSPLAIEQTNFDIWTTINDINVENTEAKSLIEKFCIDGELNFEDVEFIMNAKGECEQWNNTIYLNNVKLDATQKTILDFYNSTGFTFKKYSESAQFYLFGGPLLAGGISFSMIIPFAVSAIFVSVNALFRSEDDTSASKFGVIVMIIGFIMVIIGILLFISLMFCNVFLNWHCGVEEVLVDIVESWSK